MNGLMVAATVGISLLSMDLLYWIVANRTPHGSTGQYYSNEIVGLIIAIGAVVVGGLTINAAAGVNPLSNSDATQGCKRQVR